MGSTPYWRAISASMTLRRHETPEPRLTEGLHERPILELPDDLRTDARAGPASQSGARRAVLCAGADATQPGRCLFCPIEHRVSDQTIVHDHGDAAGNTMINATPSMSPAHRPQRCQPASSLAASQQCRSQCPKSRKSGSHLREPPPPGGNRDARVCPRNHTVDHHGKGHEEQEQDKQCRPVNLPNSELASPPDMNCFSLSAFWSVDQGLGRIFLHSFGITHHKEDAHDCADHKDDDSPDQSFADRQCRQSPRQCRWQRG